jgi:hypothetical protein
MCRTNGAIRSPYRPIDGTSTEYCAAETPASRSFSQIVGHSNPCGPDGESLLLIVPDCAQCR